MSIDFCKRCGHPVDTDADCDCYLPDPRMSFRYSFPDICMCERCREQAERDAEVEAAAPNQLTN